MNIFKYFLWFRYVISYTKNPLENGLYYLGFKNEVTCYLKDNMGQIELNQQNKYLLGASLVALNDVEQSKDISKKKILKRFIKSLNGEYWDLNGVKFNGGGNEYVLWEYFSYCPYFDYDLNGKTVLDIGGNIGDTALLMAKEGATVFSFEPVPDIYQLAMENIENNPELKNKIHMYNYAIDGEDGKIELFMESLDKNTSTSSFKNVGKKIIVKSYSIESAIKKFSIKPDILKIDCEGSEYNIIENSDLSMFNHIVLEYHEEFVGRPHEILVKRLESMGFEVTVKKNPSYKINEFGFIVAKK